jgi:hypothetical protein
MKVKLRLTGNQHASLCQHLLSADGNESVAIALCGRRAGEKTHALCVRRLILISNNDCLVRSPNQVTWRTGGLPVIFEEAASEGFAIVKIHSHPGGHREFSIKDDKSDMELLAAAQSWTDSSLPHASAVILPDGEMFGRWLTSDQRFNPITTITVAGVDLKCWFADDDKPCPAFADRVSQAFGIGTTERLARLSVAVIGCSGTGSPVIEQLVRNGVGHLVLVDPDHVELNNLNRITFARMCDVGRLKVHAAADWIASTGLGTAVDTIPLNLCDSQTIKHVAECDVVIGCMDGSEGRYLLNKLATFYCLPYFDVGVRLDADGAGGIAQICGTVNYLQPDGSSFLSRKVLTMEAVQSEGLKRTNPAAYASQVASKYIRGVSEDRPAVISVNMHYASLAVLELLARLHSFRVDGNAQFSQFGSSLTDPRFEPMRSDGAACPVFSKHVGRGDVIPLLDSPYLSERAL